MASYSVLKRPRDSADYRLISQAIDGGEKNEPNAVPGVKTNALARVVKRFCYSQNERVTFKFQTFFFHTGVAVQTEMSMEDIHLLKQQCMSLNKCPYAVSIEKE